MLDATVVFLWLLQLLGRDETVLLGLVLLQTASEELTSSRDDVIAARKEQLQQLLHQDAAHLLHIISGPR